MQSETLNLPLILTNLDGNHKRALMTDIQGNEIIISPNAEADLPNPIQPSLLYMEASLPVQLQALSLPKERNFSPDSRLKRLLPLPLLVHQASVCSSSSMSPAYSVVDDDEEGFEDDDCVSRKRSYTLIPLLLNPIDGQESPQINEKMIAINATTTDFYSSFTASSSCSPSNTMIGSKQYDCTFCEKKFMRPSSLKIHTYSHTGEKPFNCSFSGCRRRFSVQSNMRRHLRVHYN